MSVDFLCRFVACVLSHVLAVGDVSHLNLWSVAAFALKPRHDRIARLEMSTFYAVLSVRPHTVCNRNLDIRTGQGDLGS